MVLKYSSEKFHLQIKWNNQDDFLISCSEVDKDGNLYFKNSIMS